MEQETLEDTAKKFTENLYYKVGDADEFNGEPLAVYDAFKDGAKWQAERMYSEEDMAESFVACWKSNVPDGIECKVSFKEWFEQNKKK